MSTSTQRRRHKKRFSALRLSSDTTATLPEYIVGWHREAEPSGDMPSDKPPDYPDSAEEADEDTDDGNSSAYVLSSPQISTLSPRRHKRIPSHTHRRKKSNAITSSNDPNLDSLFARSVHALEMSNTLLQSSMSTQSSLSVVLTSDSPVDSMLETSARGLSSRIQGNGDVHDTLVDNLEEISKGVEGLFAEGSRGGSLRINGRTPHLADGSISSSLPTSSALSHSHRHRRRPSLLDLREASVHQAPHLHLSLQDRSDLVSPPPRALTQYVASDAADLDAVALPSTLGLRASSSLHSLRGSPSLPKLTDRPLEPSTPAYNMLSSFVYRSPSPCSSITSAIPSLLSRKNSRNGSTNTEHTITNPYQPSHKSADCSRISSDSSSVCRSSCSLTPKQIITTLPRSMTPPTEESSSEGGTVTRTIQSLRKILDEQPPPPEPPRLRPPAFLPRTPAPAAEAGTSTATASISRLFTKAKHSSSTSPSSPPRHSAMKHPTPNGNGALTPNTTSASSSGWSTPKRISFAKLPESYAGSRPEGSSSRFRERDKQRRRVGRSKEDKKGKDRPGEAGWWMNWLVGAPGSHSSGTSGLRQEERMEDRLSRNWSGRMGPGFGPTLDDWAI